MVKVKPEIVDGVKWYPFNLEFTGVDGTVESKFHVTLYATSHYHAECLLEDLKRTGKIVSRVVAKEL